MATTPSPRSTSSRRITSQPRVIVARDGGRPPNVVTPGRRKRILAAVSISLIAAVLLYDASALNRLRERPITGVDYVPIVEYVSARHTPGEAILAALPATAYLAVESTDDLIFLSSPLNRKRAQRYTRLTADGRYLDYWTGVDSVVDVAGLCNTLLTAPNIWVLVDTGRLEADWAYLGPMADVIVGMTYAEFETLSGAQVRRLAPAPARDPWAERVCTAALTGERIPTRPAPVIVAPQ